MASAASCPSGIDFLPTAGTNFLPTAGTDSLPVKDDPVFNPTGAEVWSTQAGKVAQSVIANNRRNISRANR